MKWADRKKLISLCNLEGIKIYLAFSNFFFVAQSNCKADVPNSAKQVLRIPFLQSTFKRLQNDVSKKFYISKKF